MAAWNIKIINDPSFCGRDAANVAFLNGSARVEDQRIAEWFAARPDIYSVEKVKETKAKATPGAKKPDAGADEKQ